MCVKAAKCIMQFVSPSRVVYFPFRKEVMSDASPLTWLSTGSYGWSARPCATCSVDGGAAFGVRGGGGVGGTAPGPSSGFAGSSPASACAFGGDRKRVAVVYALFVKSAEYASNFRYFLYSGGMLSAPDVSFFVVCNEIPQNGDLVLRYEQEQLLKEAQDLGAHVLRRGNTGFDFGGWADAIRHFRLLDGSGGSWFTHFIFLNTSCRGPFMPTYARSLRWTDAFLSHLGGDVHLVGPTINVFASNGAPHVQSYAFGVDVACLAMLWAAGLFAREYDTIHDVIMAQEVGMSSMVLGFGWNISAFPTEFAGVDYRNPGLGCVGPTLPEDDVLHAGGRCSGRDLHPVEIMFMKTSRGVNTDAVVSLTRAAWGDL